MRWQAEPTPIQRCGALAARATSAAEQLAAASFYLPRWRARAAYAASAPALMRPSGCAIAQEAESLMRATTDQPANASRRWMLMPLGR